MAIACAMRTPAVPQSEIKGSHYGMDGLAPGFLRDRRPWEEPIAEEGDEAGTSGGGDANETGTWGSVDDDGWFSSLVDIFLRHGGSLETIQELIRGVKARTEEEMENWGPGRIRLRASTDPSEPNIFMDDRKEVEKWEHLEELWLWMKHVVGLMSDIVNNGLGRAFFVSIFLTQEKLPLLKDKLLESQEKLLKAYKELVALEEEKKEREAALTKAQEASEKAIEETVQLRERTMTTEEAVSKAWEEALFYKDAAA